MYEKRGFCFPGFNIVVTEITVSPCGGMEKERKRGKESEFCYDIRG